MGDFGAFTRILGAKYGAAWTYAAFNREARLAPGLPAFEDLRDVYHYDAIDADTHVLGVVGDPVGHSLSPLLHNAAFRHHGINAVYVPFRVRSGELPAFVASMEVVPVLGYSVTIPHKEAAAALAATAAETVTGTGSANTLVRQEDGAFAGASTDYLAALESLLAILPLGPTGQPSLENRNVLVLGAGGLGRCAAHALHQAGALVTVTNRTLERAQALAAAVPCRVVDWGARHGGTYDVIVNCTSVGMHPNVDESPIHPGFLRPGLVVMDTVYNPETTLLVKEARNRGCRVQTGVDMFVRQAGEQFRLFTGQEPPLDLMTNLVRRALSPVAVRSEEPAEPTPEDE
jgi:3-dehydroquinate dehydratase/shikimate dehydrogenase